MVCHNFYFTSNCTQEFDHLAIRSLDAQIEFSSVKSPSTENVAAKHLSGSTPFPKNPSVVNSNMFSLQVSATNFQTTMGQAV